MMLLMSGTSLNRDSELCTDWKTQTNLEILHTEVIPFDPPCFFLSTPFSLLYHFQHRETKLLTVFKHASNLGLI